MSQPVKTSCWELSLEKQEEGGKEGGGRRREKEEEEERRRKMSRGEKRRGREGWEKGDKEEKWKEKLGEGGGG